MTVSETPGAGAGAPKVSDGRLLSSGAVSGLDVVDTGPSARPTPDNGSQPALGGEWCDRCGEALCGGRHDACAVARALEPPRYCQHCRRRMKVQVFPHGWRATCVEHGEIRTR